MTLHEPTASDTGCLCCHERCHRPEPLLSTALGPGPEHCAGHVSTPDQYVVLSEWETRDARDAYPRSEHFAR